MQLIEQRLRLLQIMRVEAFSEPVVDRSERFASLLRFALVAAWASETHCSAEFPRLGLLSPRYILGKCPLPDSSRLCDA